MNDLVAEAGTLIGALLVGLVLYGLLQLCLYAYWRFMAWLEGTDEQ